MAKKKTTEIPVSVKIHGLFDLEKKKIVRVSLDPDEIGMEAMLIGESKSLKAFVLTMDVVLDFKWIWLFF